MQTSEYAIISAEVDKETLKLKFPLEIAKTIKTLVQESKDTSVFLRDLVYFFPVNIETSKNSWRAYCLWKKRGELEHLEKKEFIMFVNIVTHLESMHSQSVKTVIQGYTQLFFKDADPQTVKPEPSPSPVSVPIADSSRWENFHLEFQNPRLTKVLEELMTKTGTEWVGKKMPHIKKYAFIHTLIDEYILNHPEEHYNVTVWNFFNRDFEVRLETECLIAMTYQFFEPWKIATPSKPVSSTSTTLKKAYARFFSTCPEFAKNIWMIHRPFLFEYLKGLNKISDKSCKPIEKCISYEDAVKYIFSVNNVESAPWNVVKVKADPKEEELIKICNDIIEHQNACGYIGQSEELVAAKHNLKTYRRSKK